VIYGLYAGNVPGGFPDPEKNRLGAGQTHDPDTRFCHEEHYDVHRPQEDMRKVPGPFHLRGMHLQRTESQVLQPGVPVNPLGAANPLWIEKNNAPAVKGASPKLLKTRRLHVHSNGF